MIFRRCVSFLLVMGIPWLGYGSNWDYAMYGGQAPETIVSGSARTQLYAAAAAGNEALLEEALESVAVDAPDQTGNSALCESVWKNNPKAFYLLRSYGASVNAPCVQKIPNSQRIIFNEAAAAYVATIQANYAEHQGQKVEVAEPESQTTRPAAAKPVSYEKRPIYPPKDKGIAAGTWVTGVGALALIAGGIALALTIGGGGGGDDDKSNGGSSSGSSGGGEDETTAECGHGKLITHSCQCNRGWVYDAEQKCTVLNSCGGIYTEKNIPRCKVYKDVCYEGDQEKYGCETCEEGYTPNDEGTCVRTACLSYTLDTKIDQCMDAPCDGKYKPSCSNCNAGYEPDSTTGGCKQKVCDAVTYPWTQSNKPEYCDALSTADSMTCQSGDVVRYKACAQCNTNHVVDSSTGGCKCSSQYTTTIAHCTTYDDTDVCQMGTTTYYKRCTECDSTHQVNSQGKCSAECDDSYTLTSPPHCAGTVEQCGTDTIRYKPCTSCAYNWGGDDCLECAAGYTGTDCDTCDDGYSRATDGTCQANDCTGFTSTSSTIEGCLFPESCTSPSNVTKYRCKTCDEANGYTPNSSGQCVLTENECHGHGTKASGATKCTCDPHWAGDTCNECATGYLGDNCSSCDTDHGYTLSGTTCVDGCEGYPYTDVSQTGNCSSKLKCGDYSRWKCTGCQEGNYTFEGGACTELCPGYPSSSQTIAHCKSVSQCPDGNWFKCVPGECEPGYTGDDCSSCADGYSPSGEGGCVVTRCLGGAGTEARDYLNETCDVPVTECNSAGTIFYVCSKCKKNYVLNHGICEPDCGGHGIRGVDGCDCDPGYSSANDCSSLLKENCADGGTFSTTCLSPFRCDKYTGGGYCVVGCQEGYVELRKDNGVPVCERALSCGPNEIMKVTGLSVTCVCAENAAPGAGGQCLPCNQVSGYMLTAGGKCVQKSESDEKCHNHGTYLGMSFVHVATGVDLCLCNDGYGGNSCNSCRSGWSNQSQELTVGSETVMLLNPDGICYPSFSCAEGECACSDQGMTESTWKPWDYSGGAGALSTNYQYCSCPGGTVNQRFDGGHLQDVCWSDDSFSCHHGIRDFGIHQFDRNGNSTDGYSNAVICHCYEGWANSGDDYSFCDVCAPGYHPDGSDCIQTLTCGKGKKQVGRTCVDDENAQDATCGIHGERVGDVCVCAKGWTGDTCATQVETDHCSGHGEVSSQTCTCDKGYMGDSCEQCTTGYVLSGGICWPSLFCGQGQTQVGSECLVTGENPEQCAGYTESDASTCITQGKAYDTCLNTEGNLSYKCINASALSCGEHAYICEGGCCCEGGYQKDASGLCSTEIPCYGFSAQQDSNCAEDETCAADHSLHKCIQCKTDFTFLSGVCVAETELEGEEGCRKQGFVIPPSAADPRFSEDIPGCQGYDACEWTDNQGKTQQLFKCSMCQETAQMDGSSDQMYKFVSRGSACLRVVEGCNYRGNRESKNDPCECIEGWEGLNCYTPSSCGEEFKLTTSGQCETYERCLSGDVSQYRCLSACGDEFYPTIPFKCQGYTVCSDGQSTFYKCTSCQSGYTLENGQCVNTTVAGAYPKNGNPRTFRTQEFKGQGGVDFLGQIKADYAYARGYTGYLVDRNADGTLKATGDEAYQTDEKNEKIKVKIGILDAGFNADHPDLKDNIAQTRNFDYGPCRGSDRTHCYARTEDNKMIFYNENENDTEVVWTTGVTEAFFDSVFPTSSYAENYDWDNVKENVAPAQNNLNHGTHVAGIIGALKNDTGMHGVVPDSSLYLANFPQQDPTDAFWFKKAMENYAENEVGVVNISAGLGESLTQEGTNNRLTFADVQGYEAETIFPTGYVNGFKVAANNNIVIVQAAGNDRLDPNLSEDIVNNPVVDAAMPLTSTFQKPGSATVSYDNSYLANLYLTVVSVVYDSATDTWGLASYSNKCGVAGSYCLAAPGGNNSNDNSEKIYSTFYEGYGYMAGTSMATPMVTGAVALLQSAYPNLTSQQVVYLLLHTANNTSAGLTDASLTGMGLIDLEKATRPYGTLSFNTSLEDIPTNTDNHFGNNVALSSLMVPLSIRSNMMAALPEAFTAFDALSRPYEVQTSVLFKDTKDHKTRIFKKDFKAFRMQEYQGEVRTSDRLNFKFTNPVLGNNTKVPWGSLQMRYEPTSRFTIGFNYAEHTLYQAGDYFKKSLENPFFKMKEAYGIGADLRLGSRTSVSLQYIAGKNGFYVDEDDDDAYDNAMMGIEMKVSHKVTPKLTFGTSVGMLHERHGLLGMTGTDAFDPTRTRTYMAGLHMGYDLTPDLAFAMAYYRGYTRTEGRTAVLSFTDIQSEALSFNMTYRMKKARVGLDLTSPLRIRRGAALFDMPVGRHPTENIVYRKTYRASLRPSSREWDVSAFYNRAISDSLNFQTKCGVRLNPEHQKGASPDYFGLFNVNWLY